MGRVLLTTTAVQVGWRPDLIVTPAGDDLVLVADATRAARVGAGTAVRRAVLWRLDAPGGLSVDRLVVEAAEEAAHGDPGAVLLAEIEARSLLHALAARGLLATRLVDERGVAATISSPALPDEPTTIPDTVVLNDDVFVRRADPDETAGLVLESAIDPGRHDPVTARFAGALLALGDPESFGDGEPLPTAWLPTLLQAGIVEPAPMTVPHRLAPHDRWEFHDRLFHSRSRLWAGPARPFGATMRLASQMAPLPAHHVPATATGPAIALAVPDLGRARCDDPPFAAVAERRRSCRRPAGTLHVDTLAEVLYRVARVRQVAMSPVGGELDRPAPSGGGIGSISLYPLVVRCDGLAPGLYHYDGQQHALRALAAAGPEALDLLVAGARQTAMLDAEGPLHVLLLMAARFGRLQYKYSGMAYAAVLKDAGVLYQSLYLTATALGLGGCALGGGDALAFERASGLQRWDEGTVGEFLLFGGGDRTAGARHGD